MSSVIGSETEYDTDAERQCKRHIAKLEAQIAAMELGVIRCKDCRHPDPKKLSDDGRPYCWKTGWYICDEFYCFMAEPKAAKPAE